MECHICSCVCYRYVRKVFVFLREIALIESNSFVYCDECILEQHTHHMALLVCCFSKWLVFCFVALLFVGLIQS